jgi:aconitate hydratase
VSPSRILDSFGTRGELGVGDRRFAIRRLDALEGRYAVSRLPYSLKVLLENVLRHEDGHHVHARDVEAVAAWAERGKGTGEPEEIAFSPERVLMQDFTGVPAIADLAAMRDAIRRLGGDPARVNPLVPVELVIDHSVIVEVSGTPEAYERNVEIEYARNHERYQLLKWACEAFDGFRVVPPGTGICHQVNLEYLARVVFATPEGEAFCDTLVGTDSHTTMVNGLGVLGWGVGGIEAEAAMLGQPSTMVLPRVIGVRLSGELADGVTATDLVLTITELTRRYGVVGCFVEFFGPSLGALPVETRATIGNMAPEYGATCAIFPIDHATLEYLRFTGRDDDHVRLVEAYAKEQGLFHVATGEDPVYTDVIELDLGSIEPCIAGPARPQDRIPLRRAKEAFLRAVGTLPGRDQGDRQGRNQPSVPLRQATARLATGEEADLEDGAVVIAAITSCTNTSNPQVMLAAGLLAKKARERGMRVPPWVKTSLAPGSRVVMDYLEAAGLHAPLGELGFHLVGFGCTTCIGNSGPLLPGVSEAVREGNLAVAAVLSGNRNFEGRIHPEVRLNYLASPPLVVAYALAGTMNVDLAEEPIGTDAEGNPVTLAELWPSTAEVVAAVRAAIGSEMFRRRYATVFEGDDRWRAVATPSGATFAWDPASTYVLRPPFLDDAGPSPEPVRDIHGARVLALLGDSVTTDHISPAGSIRPDGPAGRWLLEHRVAPRDFNSFGARRGNHEVMARGTFANVRLRNLLVPGSEGGVTRHFPDGEVMSIYDAAMRYRQEGVPLVVVAGSEYGSGSSRDWAAKGPALLGVVAVVAESFERIHRSNLVGMGILPLELPPGSSWTSLGLTGEEQLDVIGLEGLDGGTLPKEALLVADGKEVPVRVRIDTPVEADYYRHGGILPYVLRQLAGAHRTASTN